MPTINDTIANLKSRNYTVAFRRESTCLSCIELGWLITPESFTVDESYYFEDATHPDRDRVVFAISSIHGLKGFLVDTYLVYEDNISAELAEKLNLNKLEAYEKL